MKKSPGLPLLAFLAVAAAFVALALAARIPGSRVPDAIPSTSTRVLVLIGFTLLLVPAAWFWLSTLRNQEPPPTPTEPPTAAPDAPRVLSVDLRRRQRPDDPDAA